MVLYGALFPEPHIALYSGIECSRVRGEYAMLEIVLQSFFLLLPICKGEFSTNRRRFVGSGNVGCDLLEMKLFNALPASRMWKVPSANQRARDTASLQEAGF